MAQQNNTEKTKQLKLKSPLYVKKPLLVFAITLLQWEYGAIDLYWNNCNPQANFFERNRLFICEKPELLNNYPKDINLILTFPERRAKEITLPHILKKISRMYRRELSPNLLKQFSQQENLQAFHNCITYCLSGEIPKNPEKIQTFPVTHFSKGKTAKELFSKDHLRSLFWNQFLTTGNDLIGSYLLLLRHWAKKQRS
jgi:hypothetical protein